MMSANKPIATVQEASQWIIDGHFTVDDGDVYSGGRKLAQRINRRRRMETGDPRVDLCFAGKRRSMHVSQVVWIAHTKQPIPAGFEIHHNDEDIMNNCFSNLICVHSLDHCKLHHDPAFAGEEVPS